MSVMQFWSYSCVSNEYWTNFNCININFNDICLTLGALLFLIVVRSVFIFSEIFLQ